jgi:prepilin-type N-terminal cleavage/methylation domain-containing protein/prepilin-type processing-associated H-X9-DG protein
LRASIGAQVADELRLKIARDPENCRREPLAAFTLIELLVVIAVIAILAGLVLPALSRAKEGGRSAYCRNSLHQLAIAFHLYLDDNKDVFPACNGDLIPEGEWLYWNPSNFSPGGIFWKAGGLSNSPIVRYIGRFSTNLFLCLSDSFLKLLCTAPDRVDSQWADKQIYRFSYTLSAGARGTFHYGVASAGDFPFRLYMARNPSETIMVAEEATYGERAAQRLRLPTWKGSAQGAAFSSGWEWPNDPLSERHRGRSNAAFIDGHIETVKPAFGMMREHYDPMF